MITMFKFINKLKALEKENNDLRSKLDTINTKLYQLNDIQQTQTTELRLLKMELKNHQQILDELNKQKLFNQERSDYDPKTNGYHLSTHELKPSVYDFDGFFDSVINLIDQYFDLSYKDNEYKLFIEYKLGIVNLVIKSEKFTPQSFMLFMNFHQYITGNTSSDMFYIYTLSAYKNELVIKKLINSFQSFLCDQLVSISLREFMDEPRVQVFFTNQFNPNCDYEFIFVRSPFKSRLVLILKVSEFMKKKYFINLPEEFNRFTTIKQFTQFVTFTRFPIVDYFKELERKSKGE